MDINGIHLIEFFWDNKSFHVKFLALYCPIVSYHFPPILKKCLVQIHTQYYARKPIIFDPMILASWYNSIHLNVN